MKNATFYSNFLASRRITPTRLRNAAENTENAMLANNAGGLWTDVLAVLSPAIQELSMELGDVDVAFNIRLGRTMTVDQVIAGFKETMSSREPFIAEALGGRNTPAYLEIYPGKISEYSHANKTNIETLLSRVRTFAATHAAVLGDALVSRLSSWQGTYEAARDAQQAQKSTLTDNRAERSTARRALELVYLSALFSVGEAFPGNEEKCGQYVDLSLLYPHGHAAAGTEDADDEEDEESTPV